MDLELKSFTRIDYNEISEIFMKALYYKRELKGDDFAIFTPDYTEYSVKMAFPDPTLFFGIYQGNKLVGTIGGSYIQCSFQGTPLIGSAINSYTLDPELLPIEREILKNVFQQLIEKLKEKGVDFVWVIIIKENNDFELKIFREDLQFTRVNKNVESLVKLLGSEGVDILREKREMNIVLAKLAKMMAGMHKIPLPDGSIRDATPKDYPRIIELLNGYKQLLPLTQIWTSESFQHFVDSTSLINSMDYSAFKKEYPDTPFGFHMKVWERNSKLEAAILYRIGRINFKNGDAPFMFIDYLACSQDLELDEKRAFLVTMYHKLYHKAIIVNAFLPFYDYKTFDKSGFMAERRKTPFLIFPLTEKGEKLVAGEKPRITKFYLPTLTDFAI